MEELSNLINKVEPTEPANRAFCNYTLPGCSELTKDTIPTEHKPAEWADGETKVTMWKYIRKKDPQPDIFNINKKGRIYQKFNSRG